MLPIVYCEREFCCTYMHCTALQIYTTGDHFLDFQYVFKKFLNILLVSGWQYELLFSLFKEIILMLMPA